MTGAKTVADASLLLFLALVAGSSAVDNILSDSNCLKCLCLVESNSTDCVHESCRSHIYPSQGRIRRARSCGAFNINMEYWILCGKPGLENNGDEESAFEQCATNSDCAKNCVKNYTKRFEASCSGEHDCMRWSRIHFSGEKGCRYHDTMPKWNKMQACLNQMKRK